MDDAELTRIWNQQAIPVILRRTGKGQLLRARLPYPTGSARVVPVTDVLRLAETHISSTDIAERLAVPYQSVRGKMPKTGIMAISEADFCRATVERVRSHMTQGSPANLPAPSATSSSTVARQGDMAAIYFRVKQRSSSRPVLQMTA